MIEVETVSSGDPYEFDVSVREGGSATRHRVTLSEDTYRELTDGGPDPARVIEAAFQFLLDREPKESILSRFDVTVISRYFPEFEREIGDYL